MSADQRWARVKTSMEPAWNDLREQRVLARVQDEKRNRLASRSRPMAWLAVAAVVLASVIGFAAYKLRAPAPVANVEAAPNMMLADGSEVTLVRDARVKLEEQGDEQVRLTQSAGEATYDVKPNPKRKFVVNAGDVTVRVLGTAFTVTMQNGKVKVHVLRGRVEVEGSGKIAVLASGETLEMPAVRPIEQAPSATSAPPPIDKKPAAPTVEQLLAKADEARAAHRYDEAASALRAMIASYPGDGRIASALFTLGRVERMRGKHAAAAEAFARCAKVAPHGALAEDALAEEAVSWKSAADAGRAKSAAQRYLKAHPSGPHAARMMPLTE